MLSQSFEEESPPGCSLTPNTSLFGESSRASCDVSGDLSCDQKPGIVPATPDLMENWTAEKSQKFPHSPMQIRGRRDECKTAVSEDPLEDFKRRREERRKTQLEFICSKSPSKLLPSIGPAPPGRSESENQKSTIQRPRKYCSVAVSCKSSLLKMMKPVGLLIPNSKLSSPEGTVKVPKVGLYVGSLSKNSAKGGAIVAKNGDTEKNLTSNSIGGREDSTSGKNGTCCDKERKTENCSEVKVHVVTDSVKSSPQSLLCQRSSSSENPKCCDDKDSPNAGCATGHSSTSKSQVFERGIGQYVLDQNAIKVAATKQSDKESVSTSLKTKRFIVNGEVCYLVPAKLFINKMQKTIQDQLPSKVSQSFATLSASLKKKTSRALAAIQTSTSGSQHGNGQSGSHQRQNQDKPRVRSYPKLKVSSFAHLKSQLHVQKGCHWLIDDPIVSQCLSAPKSTPELTDKVVGYQRRVCTRLHPHYTSTSIVKHSHPARSCLHISRLHKSNGDSKCIGQIEGKSQSSQEKSSVDGVESKVSDVSGCKGKTSSKDLTLHFVINASKAGTFIFADEKSFQDIDEPPLWINMHKEKKRTTTDQIVPDLSSNQENLTKSQSDDIERKHSERVDGEDAMGLILQEIKSLIGVSSDVDKLNLINRACDFIRDLELGIRGVLKAMGCDDSVVDVLLGGNFYKDKSDRAVNCKTTSRRSKRKRSSEFLVPQSSNSIEKTRKDSPVTGRFKPSSVDRLTSPALTIGGSGWDGMENQVYVPPQSRSALPLSSQLSFSESMTDDSENVTEFDLLFENSPSRNERRLKQYGGSSRKQNGSTFHAYVNEVLDEIFEDDFDTCGKATPKKTRDQSSMVDFSTPIDHVTSPSWYDFRSSPSEKSSHCGDTPQSFSVHSLDHEFCDDVKHSPKWYHTVEQDIRHAYDATGPYHGSLSMKVVENDSRCDDLPMIGTTTESLKSNFIINTFNEREKITEAEDGEDKFTSYLKEIIDKESRSLREDEDAAALKVLEDIAMRKDQDELLPPVTNTIILARDLLKSDLLASFLFPRPRFIPEDPFGIGAETIIEKTTNAASQDDDEDDNTWQSNIEVTPPQSKRGLLGTPPKVRKGKGVKRKSSQKADGRSTRTRQKQKADLIELQESPLGVHSDEETSCQDFVFLPEVQKQRGQENSRTQKRKPRVTKRKRKSSEDISFGASTSKKMSTTSKKKKNAETGKRTKSICKDVRTRKTRAPLHRRQALNSIN